MPISPKTLLCFAMIVATSFSADAAEICLNSEYRCREQIVRLGDVADVRDEDASRAQKLAALELFPAPGRVKTLRQSELCELLTLASVDVLTCRWSGATTVTIHPITESKTAKSAPGTKPLVKNAKVRQAPASPRLVVVSVRPLRKGEIVRAVDIDLQPATNPVQHAFFKPDEVIGKETTRALATGQTLEPDHVRPLVLVRRGEVVRVVAKAAGVRIKTNGRAAQDGGQGELIEVQQLDGKQRYTARVVDYQEVEVYAQGPSAQ